jgi:hypothetical protein
MKLETYNCDVCGKLRDEENHWFLFSAPGNQNLFSIQPWDEEEAEYRNHVCGRACAQTMMEKTIEGWKDKV